MTKVLGNFSEHANFVQKFTTSRMTFYYDVIKHTKVIKTL